MLDSLKTSCATLSVNPLPLSVWKISGNLTLLLEIILQRAVATDLSWFALSDVGTTKIYLNQPLKQTKRKFNYRQEI